MFTAEPAFRLTMPSDPRQLTLARHFLQAVCECCPWARPHTDAILLAVHEAIQNIIRHAHHGRHSALVEIQCFPSPDRLEIDLLDQGEPFDLTAVPDLDPSELRVGGRGVFLMRRLMDELSCRPRPSRGNVLRMVKHFSQTRPA